VTTLSKDDYLKQSRALATGFGPTQDFADPQIGATVQADAGIPDQAQNLPGQVFTVDQLPNPAVAVAYGLPPVTVPEHLILDNEDDGVRHIQAKDALDVVTGELRKELGSPVVAFDGTIRSEEDSLFHLEANTGAGVGDPDKVSDDSAVFVDGVKGGDGETITTDDGVDTSGADKGAQGDPAVQAEASTSTTPKKATSARADSTS
jgi:hypothetical protein